MTDQTPTCEQVRLLDGTPTRIRHGHGIDEPCPFGPRPDSGIDERERELRKRLTQHHRDQHLTAATCPSCLAVLARLSTPRTSE